MTPETLKKAKELETKIAGTIRAIDTFDRTMKEDGKILNFSVFCGIYFSPSVSKSIHDVVYAELQSQLEQFQKEFEEL